VVTRGEMKRSLDHLSRAEELARRWVTAPAS
jgi:hypothetical protein